MRINITKKNIIITPAPNKDKKNGLKIYFWRGEKDERESTSLPIMTTDIKKGQSKYLLPTSTDVSCAIKRIEF